MLWPVWTESWFPDAFIGTMAQLLIALETGQEPVINGRDNLKTMALVEAAYLSAAQYRSVPFLQRGSAWPRATFLPSMVTVSSPTMRVRQVRPRLEGLPCQCMRSTPVKLGYGS